MKTKDVQYQYFSRWRQEWIDFRNPPTPGDFFELKKYHYQIRIKPVGHANETTTKK